MDDFSKLAGGKFEGDFRKPANLVSFKKYILIFGIRVATSNMANAKNVLGFGQAGFFNLFKKLLVRIIMQIPFINDMLLVYTGSIKASEFLL